MRIASICIWFVLFCALAVSAESCPTVDPHVQIVAPSPVNQQATNIFDTKTWCSPSASDITIQCPNDDYVHQFMDSRWNSTSIGNCMQNFEGSFTKQEFFDNAIFNSTKEAFEIHLRITYYLKSIAASKKWWFQSHLIVFSIQYKKISKQDVKPIAFPSKTSPEVGDYHMHGLESIKLSPKFSEVCHVDLKNRNCFVCESYLSVLPHQGVGDQNSKSVKTAISEGLTYPLIRIGENGAFWKRNLGNPKTWTLGKIHAIFENLSSLIANKKQ